MAAQYSAQWNIAAALVGDPGDPATYGPDRITDPAIAALQSKVVSVTAHPDFDATYAWRMGGRVRITLDDGSVHEQTVHGQTGSMHDPLTSDQIDAKFALVTGGLLVDPVEAAAAIRGAAAGAGLLVLGSTGPASRHDVDGGS